MSRPDRHDVDYFPFYAKDGKTLFILESKYGCAGTGFFTNVLRFLSLQHDHNFCIADEADRMYFFSKTKCDEDVGLDMLEIMSKTGKIDSSLYADFSVIVSEDHLNSISDAYRKRKNECVTIDEIRDFWRVTTGRNAVVSEFIPEETHTDQDVSCISTDIKPQSKVKESKESKTFAKDSVEFDIARYLLMRLRDRNPEHKQPNMQTWSSDADKILRIDKRNPVEVKAVIDWCQNDKFWYKNVMSISTLRDKYDRLKVQMNEGAPKKKKRTYEDGRVEII